MNTKNNQRYRDTQKAITDSYLQLLETHNANRITVREICQVAGVNRSTFYAHFDDIVELQHSINLQMWQTVCAELQIDENTKYFHQSRDFFMVYLRHVREQQIFYRSFMDRFLQVIELEKESEWGSALFYRGEPLSVSLADEVPLKEWKNFRTRKEREYAFAFCEAGIVMCIKRWLNNGCVESIEEMCDILLKLIH